MTSNQVIRAWRDPEYRDRLSQAERGLLPAHPAGLIELSDDDLVAAAGGLPKDTLYCTCYCVTVGYGCPSTWPWNCC